MKLRVLWRRRDVRLTTLVLIVIGVVTAGLWAVLANDPVPRFAAPPGSSSSLSAAPQSVPSGLSASPGGTASGTPNSSGGPVVGAQGSSTGAVANSSQSSGGFPPLPSFSNGVNYVRDDGVHQVKIEVTSDSAILRLRYAISEGKPDYGAYNEVRVPFRVESQAHGKGLLAAIQAQASRFASTITCKIYIDGKLQTQHSESGQYAVTACYA